MKLHHQSARSAQTAPFSRRLLRQFGMVLIIVLILAIVTAGIVVFADMAQRRRILREQAALSAGGYFLDIDGATVHFRKSGPAADSISTAADEPPLVLLHGLMGSSQDFEFIQPILAKKRAVIAVDLLGFGLSDKSAALNFSKKAMADMVAGLMDRLGYSRYDVLGHSMGGEVALNLALAYPNRVSRLILLDSAGLAQNGPGRSGDPTAGGSPSRVSPLLIDLVFKNYFVEQQVFRTCLYDPKAYMPEAFEKLYYFVAQIPPETLARFITDSDSGNIAGKLGEIGQPTRIIWGEQDRIIPLAQGRLLQTAIPGSQLQVIPQSGHLSYLEKPGELAALIEAFLD